jgi:NRAMP (natural resistance-associated macrophage protein)-like metal ion transporter
MPASKARSGGKGERGKTGNSAGKTASKEQKAEKQLQRSGPLGKLKVYLRMLGPGLITGASDDDPSGIGTYSQAGAQFGFGPLWTALFSFPLMAGVQEICARIALHTGHSLTELIRRNYPKPVLYCCVSLLFFANTVNLGADLGAMAAACQLLLGLPFVVWLVVITLGSTLLQIYLDYQKYAKVLRFLTLSLLCYVLVFFVTPMDWKQVLRGTLVPSISFDRDYLLGLVAILGTTISPYLFFWQTNLEIEEKIADGQARSLTKPATPVELKWMRTDVVSGMLFSNVIMWFIIATAGASFFLHGIRKIDSALQAAQMLEPIAGRFSSLVFAMGIVGTGLLAVPILAGSAAYAVAETFSLRKGLYRKLHEAPGFYAVIVCATLAGFLMNLTGIDPIKALYYAAILNGVAAPPLLVMVMLISGSRGIMSDKANSPVSSALGWITTAVMTAAALALLLTLGSGQE